MWDHVKHVSLILSKNFFVENVINSISLERKYSKNVHFSFPNNCMRKSAKFELYLAQLFVCPDLRPLHLLYN